MSNTKQLRFQTILLAIITAILALFIFIGLSACNKTKSCYQCKTYYQGTLQDVTEICDESQVESFKKANKGAGIAVSCQK